MPAMSEAQRRALNAKFGHDWVKRHHFDNSGPLPERAGKKGSLHEKMQRGPKKRKRKRANLPVQSD